MAPWLASARLHSKLDASSMEAFRSSLTMNHDFMLGYFEASFRQIECWHYPCRVGTKFLDSRFLAFAPSVCSVAVYFADVSHRGDGSRW